MKASHATEGVAVPGGDHPTALGQNRHGKTYEKYEVPE
jgi:hypothetical protein